MDDVPFTPFCPSFRSGPAAGLLYLTPAHRDVLAMIRTWSTGDRPVLTLTAEPGAGKTALALEIEDIFAGSMRVGRIGQTNGQRIDLPHEVPKAFGIAPGSLSDDPMAGLGRLLADCRAGNRKCLLIVDEAQGLSDTALDYLAQLTKPSGNRPPSFYVLLVGGSGLAVLLARPGHDALRSRIGGRLRLSPFTEDETADYVAHRFRVPGCSCHAGIQAFDAAGLGLLHAASGGLPKAINHLAQRCLFEASPSGSKKIDGAFVQACLSDMAEEEGQPHLRPAAPRQEGRRAVRPDTAPVASPSVARPAQTQEAEAKITMPAQGAVRAPVRGPRPVTELDLGSADRSGQGGRRGLLLGLAITVTVTVMGAGGLFLVPGSDPVTSTGVTTLSSPAPQPPSVAAAPEPAPDAAQTAAGPDLRPQLPQDGQIEAVPDPESLLAEALAAGSTDPERAAQLYTRAALWGSDRAAYYLGQLYESGIGVEADLLRARGWYEMAPQVAGAVARLAELATVSEGGDITAAPVPVRQTEFGSGQTELHWREPEGAGPAGFRVEFVPAGDGGQVQHMDTKLSALLIAQPIARWRVSALQPDGVAGPASDWSLLAPASR